MSRVHRMYARSEKTNPVDGTVVWSPLKSIWYSAMATVGIVGGAMTFSWGAAIIACGLTVFTICFGHTVGLHRLLIHRSFKCPLWLEYCMVSAGVLVGMGGPRKMLYMHDIRDWSQRHPKCHAFFIHTSPIWMDWFWNLHCEIRLDHPPELRPESRVTRSKYYALLDRYWMLTQLPVAVALFLLGGVPWVVWGICVRVTVSLTGHWLVGFLAHNHGRQTWHVGGAAVQGYNVVGLGLITMGEAWHNNHHAFPESAKLGLKTGQPDAGWWLLCVLRRLGLVWDVRLPEDLPVRAELTSIEGVGAAGEWATRH
ncbi:MAG: acyl-CoA desaturase [Planctomycetes bacterium]|nr:acyl-CoA desaturase [Planctomycetota bacterium]